MRSFFYLGLFTTLVACGCNNSAESGQPATDPAPSSKPSRQAEQPPAATDSVQEQISEIDHNHFKGMRRDSMKVTYRLITDYFYGYRNDDTLHMGRDTLHVEGDILMNYPQAGIRGVGASGKLWPVNRKKEIVIPYIINPGYKFRERIWAAMQMWKDSIKVNFIDKGSLDLDYVEFIPSQNTQSYVGRTHEGKQTIELADWAMAGNVAHEIGHTLGLYHEMTRSDRDKSVRININCRDNVNFQHAFIKDPYAIDLGPYDYFSIMHYSPSPCLEVTTPGLPAGIPGQRKAPSKGDVRSIIQMYKLK